MSTMLPDRSTTHPSNANTTSSHIKPLTLTLTGHSSIPHPAQRALMLLTVSDSNASKPAASDKVLITAKQVSDLCCALSPRDSSPGAKAAAPLCLWTQTSLSLTSHVPYAASKTDSRARQYTAVVMFSLRFRAFDAMQQFATKITELSCAEISRIDWILLPATRRALQSRLRCDAAADALQKAKDYCSILCASAGAGQDSVSIRPVEVVETSTDGWLGRCSQQAAQAQHQMPQQSVARSSGVFGSKISAQGIVASSDDGKERNESGLDFRPQEVRMSMDVQVKFAVDAVGVPVPTSTPNAKRQKPSEEDEEMEGFRFEHV